MQNRHNYNMTREEFGNILDGLVEKEGTIETINLSGGEPTLHQRLLDLLDACLERPIGRILINTNGIAVAQDDRLLAYLERHRRQIEVYLQFDSFERDALMRLRGADLRSIREKALERLNRHGLSTTLVVTVEKGVNDHEIGKIIDFALEQPCVRGVTLQPVQAAGCSSVGRCPPSSSTTSRASCARPVISRARSRLEN